MSANDHNTPLPAPAAPAGELRASHQDRDTVVERLRNAAVEGRIDHDELDERLERALTSKTHAELAALTADLPVPQDPEEQLPPLVLKGGMSGAVRGPGRWEAPAYVIAHGGVGGVKIDFSRVRSRLREILVEAYGETSGVTVVIPDGWTADTTGMDPGVGGLRDRTTPDRLPGTPLIRLAGSGGMGGVIVRHPNDKERRKLDENPA
ncbi:DUF1707 SHOCT-like domain-containing protein [Nocardiopsis changdeensis]|uniref:DUF1707 domain-containing protein n=1 Tax=Nocardiopsis changdeensis TaxID=2831969 RepID=A0ABX8BS00_9ACTN|nr:MULTISPECIES: DUF1707 domain-containing protein [Nocardiopsis]QUX25020.1 DUF1707 domain-containing protein [Nocardiopsis changdeensis]QYX35406.1 DUF1707 domain-containing protein [Nocardiopsis sp. MT53]